MKRPPLALLIPAYLFLLTSVQRTAVADWARFTQTPTTCTGIINGQPVTLPPLFRLEVSGFVNAEGRVISLIYPEIGLNGHGNVWQSANIDGSLWCGPAGDCPIGHFGGNRYDDWEEFYPTFLVLGGYPMDTLQGEPVFSTTVGDTVTVRIGIEPLPLLMPAETVQDIFDFLAAWFAGTVNETPTAYMTRWFAQ